MDVHSRSSRAGAATAVTALLLCTSLAAADAASSARASATRPVTSASWGAVATTSTASPFGTGPLTLSIPNTGNNGNPVYPPVFFTVGNTGTLAISGATYTAVGSPAGVAVTIDSCSGTWNESANTCSGTIAAVVSTSTSPRVSSTVPAASGSAVRLRATVAAASVPNKTTPAVTIGVEVTRLQTRAATVTGS